MKKITVEFTRGKLTSNFTLFLEKVELQFIENFILKTFENERYRLKVLHRDAEKVSFNIANEYVYDIHGQLKMCNKYQIEINNKI